MQFGRQTLLSMFCAWSSLVLVGAAGARTSSCMRTTPRSVPRLGGSSRRRTSSSRTESSIRRSVSCARRPRTRRTASAVTTSRFAMPCATSFAIAWGMRGSSSTPSIAMSITARAPGCGPHVHLLLPLRSSGRQEAHRERAVQGTQELAGAHRDGLLRVLPRQPEAGAEAIRGPPWP